MITMFDILAAALEGQSVRIALAAHRPGPDLRCVACKQLGQARRWPCAHAEAANMAGDACQRRIAEIEAQVNTRMWGH